MLVTDFMQDFMIWDCRVTDISLTGSERQVVEVVALKDEKSDFVFAMTARGSGTYRMRDCCDLKKLGMSYFGAHQLPRKLLDDQVVPGYKDIIAGWWAVANDDCELKVLHTVVPD